MARRARIILACADGRDSKQVAPRLHVTPGTVCKWRGRFIQARLEGLYDEPRPGAKRTITDEQVEQVIIRTLESTPRGATHWSTREMAKAVGLSHMAISRIWRMFRLQPHRSETFKLSNDPLLVDKVRDIVGLYLDPPAHAAVFCVDEKPQIQALDRTQPLLPMQPGQVERRTHDYKRHGTTTLFAALNAKTSDVITQFHQRHRSAQFREFLDLRRLDVHIIMDNYSTHKTALIRNCFAKRPRFHVHFTPTYGSWLSLVERWFAELTMKQIRRGAFRSVPQLKAAIQEFIEAHQANPKPFVWTKSADEILASIARFAQRTVDARAAQSMSRTTVTGH
jgi:transposase